MTAYNNSPEDSDDIESYLIDLLENSFELLDDEVYYNSLVSLLGKFTFKDKKDRDDFTNFYRTLKELLGYNEQGLTMEQFNKLIEKMTFSNAVSIGNTDIITADKKKQNHAPNEDVQFVIRKLFNTLVGDENYFDLKKPELFGKETREKREAPLSEEFISIPNEFDRIRLTR
ncbi:TPA: KAP family P-loop NTPase fold protein, partial [Streptococcus pneumoniae]